jgi:hypothetical protein
VARAQRALVGYTAKMSLHMVALPIALISTVLSVVVGFNTGSMMLPSLWLLVDLPQTEPHSSVFEILMTVYAADIAALFASVCLHAFKGTIDFKAVAIATAFAAPAAMAGAFLRSRMPAFWTLYGTAMIASGLFMYFVITTLLARNSRRPALVHVDVHNEDGQKKSTSSISDVQSEPFSSIDSINSHSNAGSRVCDGDCVERCSHACVGRDPLLAPVRCITVKENFSRDQCCQCRILTALRDHRF